MINVSIWLLIQKSSCSASLICGMWPTTVSIIQKVLDSNPSWIPDFFFPWIYFSLSQPKNIIHECLLLSPVNNIQPLNFTTSLGYGIGLVGGLKVAKFRQGFQFSPALREWESVGIRLRPLGNAAYVPGLPLLCHGSKRLNGKSIWLVFKRSWVWIPAGSRIFFPLDLFLTLSIQKHSAYCHHQ